MLLPSWRKLIITSMQTVTLILSSSCCPIQKKKKLAKELMCNLNACQTQMWFAGLIDSYEGYIALLTAYVPCRQTEPERAESKTHISNLLADWTCGWVNYVALFYPPTKTKYKTISIVQPMRHETETKTSNGTLQQREPMQGRWCFSYGCLMDMDYRALKMLCLLSYGNG